MGWFTSSSCHWPKGCSEATQHILTQCFLLLRRGVEEVAQRQREALEAVTTRPPGWYHGCLQVYCSCDIKHNEWHINRMCTNEWLLCTCAISPVLCCSCSGASDWPGEPRMGCLDAVYGPAVSPAEQAGMYAPQVPCTHWSCAVQGEGMLLVIMVDWGVTTIRLALPTSPPPPPPFSLLPLPLPSLPLPLLSHSPSPSPLPPPSLSP